MKKKQVLLLLRYCAAVHMAEYEDSREVTCLNNTDVDLILLCNPHRITEPDRFKPGHPYPILLVIQISHIHNQAPSIRNMHKDIPAPLQSIARIMHSILLRSYHLQFLPSVPDYFKFIEQMISIKIT